MFHSGGPCPDKVKLAWIERVGARKVYEMYGETEMIASTFIRGEEWLQHRGSVDALRLRAAGYADGGGSGASLRRSRRDIRQAG